jgi:hypothetical protein
VKCFVNGKGVTGVTRNKIECDEGQNLAPALVQM